MNNPTDNDRQGASGGISDRQLPLPTANQPIQVLPFDESFSVNQVQHIDLLLANHYKPNDIIVDITNQILGALDKQLVWSRIQTYHKCRISFRASIVGVYTINIELANQQQFGAQFQVKAYDLSKVFIDNSSDKCRLNESYEFGVDASEAGEGQLEIAVNEGEIPNQVQVLDNGKCIVNFVPEDTVPHVVDIKFNGHNVNGCPFVVEVESSSSKSTHLQVSEPILTRDERILVNSQAKFAIENLELDRIDKNDILILDPENQPTDYQLVEEASSRRYVFKFKPTIVGDYTIEFGQDSTLIKKLPSIIAEQLPFSLKVFDFNKVIVSDVTDGVIGHPIFFFIDASQAGSGNLEIRVSSTTRNVPNYPQSEANAKIRVNFTPTEAVDHTIDVKFNGISVPNNPFLVKVNQYPQARLPVTSQDLLKYVPIDELTSFYVDYIGTRSSTLSDNSCEVKVITPDFVCEKLKTIELVPSEKNDKQARFKVGFKPTRIGPYKLFVAVNNELLPGSPILTNVYNIQEVKVYFESNKNAQASKKPVGKVNEPVTFTVDASRAGEGTLALAVVSSLSRNAVQTDVKVSEKGHGLYNLTFVPTELAPHSIDMSFNDRLVPLSPFIVDIQNAAQNGNGQLKEENKEELVKELESLSLKNNKTVAKPLSRDEELLQSIVVHGISLKRTPVNSTGAFIIETNGMAQARDFDVLITDPNNSLVGVQCYLQQDGNLLAEWMPRRVGRHKIEVLYKDRPVLNSPFTTEAFDPSGVIIESHKTTQFSLEDTIEFKINRREAGIADLEAVVTNSAGEEQPVEIKELENDTQSDVLIFKPTAGGVYKLSITYSGYEVPKSPLTFTVKDHNEQIKVEGSGLKCAEVNRSAQFSVETSADGELKLRIECGDREIVPKVERRGRSYLIKYKPTEIGYATISLYWLGVHIEGSPFSVPVNDLGKIMFMNKSTSSSKSSNVNGTNQIAMDYEPRVAKEITVDVSQCGPGRLKAEAYCRANPSLKFSIPVNQISTDKYKLVFTCPPKSEQLSQGVSPRDISLEATYLLRFYYNNLLVPETLASVILSPARGSSKTLQEPVARAKSPTIEHNNNNNTKPPTMLESNAETAPINDESNNMTCDPSKVICTADSLKGGVLGEEIKTFIDTRKAGPGELTALCTGPQKVAFCELLDRGDGTFILYIKPQEAGRQFLTIKYGGQHIPKSPFLIKVSGKPDPTKVRVYGPGVEHGVLSLYQSRFVCDTRGAGAGQLTVRIRGPKGAFRMETQRESQRDRTILCKYDPTEPGDYRIEIKWSGRHVPGSPFSVMIFDTQEELNRFLMSQNSNAHNSKMNGSSSVHHQVPFQPTMVEYGGHYGSQAQQQQQPQFRLQ